MKKLSVYLIVAILLFSSTESFAQQETQFSQYYHNPYFFNPAAGGTSQTIQFNAGFRKQWVGIEGSPQTFYASGHSEIKINNKSEDVIGEFNTRYENIFESPETNVGRSKQVVGGRVLTDNIGPFQKNSVLGSYAYHIPFNREHMISLGLSAGWTNFGINSSKVNLLDQDDAQYDNFFARNVNQNIFDINAGIAYYSTNFHFGVASAQLLNNDVKIDQIMTENNFGRHLYVYGMYRIATSDEMEIEPHFMLQTIKGAPLSFNLGARIHINKKYWANVAYRFGDAINLGFGLNIARNFTFGYSYDFGAGAVQKISNSVHELHLGYILGRNRNVEKELSK